MGKRCNKNIFMHLIQENPYHPNTTFFLFLYDTHIIEHIKISTGCSTNNLINCENLKSDVS